MVHLSLDWRTDLDFKSSPGFPGIELQSSNPAVASPPQALAYATMACMGMDVVHVLKKGRHDFRGMTITFQGERAADHPKRFLSMKIHFQIAGVVPPHVVERAIELSRTKYCSVWNTIREDVQLVTSYKVSPES
jgi:uncharacterized OsmC-like protein